MEGRSSVMAEMALGGPLLGLGEGPLSFGGPLGGGASLASSDPLSVFGFGAAPVAPLAADPPGKSSSKRSKQASPEDKDAPPPVLEALPEDLDSWTKEELSDACRVRGLSRTGTRKDLIGYLKNPESAPRGRASAPKGKQVGKKRKRDSGEGAGDRSRSPSPGRESGIDGDKSHSGGSKELAPSGKPPKPTKSLKAEGGPTTKRLTTASVLAKHGLKPNLSLYDPCFRQWASSRVPKDLDKMLSTKCKRMPDENKNDYYFEVCTTVGDEYEDATMGEWFALGIGEKAGCYYSFCQRLWLFSELGWVHENGGCQKSSLFF